jgi:ABC-type branched-subunit amino acid transport system substrate-binding protein
VFLQGHLAGRHAVAAPASFEGRIFVAFPTSPGDHSPAGRQEFAEFRQRHGLPRRHLAAQIRTYTAAKLMVEGLSQAGRDLSREKLLLALEGLYRYATGFTPPLTYGPNRHIGALGAHIVAVDVANRRFAAGSTWVEPD